MGSNVRTKEGNRESWSPLQQSQVSQRGRGEKVKHTECVSQGELKGFEWDVGNK